MENKVKKIYVLVVDDQDVIRSLFSDLLSDRGYRVVTVTNGQEAIEAAKRINFAIAFIDVHMPVMNGLQTLKVIKKLRPQTKVVMMDSYANALLEQIKNEDVLSCIHKPFEIKQVLEIMEEVNNAGILCEM